MNKAVVIGAIIAIIVGIIIVSAVSNDSVEETIPVEETENEEKGKDITVELSEKMGFKIK